MKAKYQLKHLEKNIDKNSECHHFESKSKVRIQRAKNRATYCNIAAKTSWIAMAKHQLSRAPWEKHWEE